VLASIKQELDDLQITIRDIKHWQKKETKEIEDRQKKQDAAGGGRGRGPQVPPNQDAQVAAMQEAMRLQQARLANLADAGGGRGLAGFAGRILDPFRAMLGGGAGGGGAGVPPRGGARRRRDAALDPMVRITQTLSPEFLYPQPSTLQP